MKSQSCHYHDDEHHHHHHYYWKVSRQRSPWSGNTGLGEAMWRGYKEAQVWSQRLGWNACSGTYSTLPAHAHVNWANSSMCICYKEEEKSTTEISTCPAAHSEGRHPGSRSVEGEMQACGFPGVSAPPHSPCMCISAGRGLRNSFYFFIKHALKMKVNYFSWHSTEETDRFQLWRANWVDTALGVGSGLCYFSGSFLWDCFLADRVYELTVSCWAARTQVKHLKTLIRSRGGESGADQWVQCW